MHSATLGQPQLSRVSLVYSHPQWQDLVLEHLPTSLNKEGQNVNVLFTKAKLRYIINKKSYSAVFVLYISQSDVNFQVPGEFWESVVPWGGQTEVGKYGGLPNPHFIVSFEHCFLLSALTLQKSIVVSL